MAYARWDGTSDVYVYEDVKGGFTCQCPPRGQPEVNCPTARDMIEHLLAHRAKGDRVPESALEALRIDAEPDVRLEEEVEGLFTCIGCPRGNEFALIDASAMLEHVMEHRSRGAKVDEETFEVLRNAATR
jgi:hypothetical protein